MSSIENQKIRKLLSGGLSENSVCQILTSFKFNEWRTAYKCLQSLANSEQTLDLLLEFFPTLFETIPDAASPDRALINFDHFVNNCHDRIALYQFLSQHPRTVEMLILLFAGSQFLSDILTKYPEKFDQIKDRKNLQRIKTRQEYISEIEQVIKDFASRQEKLTFLRRFQKWELMRIGAADLFGFIDLPSVTAQLTNLAIVCIQSCLKIVSPESDLNSVGFAILALGKLGGRELNYSSDIDLLFISNETKSDFQTLGQHLIEALTEVTSEGFLYRVDMRLRPWGKIGKLVPTLDENISYLSNNAKIWEKQAMYKARAIAGDEILAIEFIQKTKPIILNIPEDKLRLEIQNMKEKIESNLKRNRHKGWGEIKAGKGSIRDVEFLTQYLQLTHGSKYAEIHSRNTLDGLARLTTAGILSASEYRILTDGYSFLRSVEHHLQIMHYRQTHQLPKDERELNYLAKRLAFLGKNAEQQLVERYEQHSEAIRKIYTTYLGKNKALIETVPTPAHLKELSKPEPNIDYSYSTTFADIDIDRHSFMFEKLTSKKPVAVEAKQIDDKTWEVTIVGYDYLGELSLICGLFFYYGLNIERGLIFTQAPTLEKRYPNKIINERFNRRHFKYRNKKNSSRRKIVDVFIVKTEKELKEPGFWKMYEDELSGFVKALGNKQKNEVQGDIARRVANAFEKYTSSSETLLPVEIAIDNVSSEKYTVLRIDAPDTIGFLFELTNALALNGINIDRVLVASIGNRVHDTLFLTDIQGQKIMSPEKQHQLRTATVLVKHFTHLLPQSPNPQSAILHFRELLSQLFIQKNWTQSLASLERPEVLDALAKLLGVSDFLWDDFLRMQYNNLFPIIQDLQTLNSSKTKEQLVIDLNNELKNTDNWEAQKSKLNQFKDREMFRIDMRYIQGQVTEFSTFSKELSDLAELVVESAIQISYNDLTNNYGVPYLENKNKCRLCVCALGKFGGRELGFASDIELMFLYEGSGQTDGLKSIPNDQFFEKLVKKFINSLTAKQAGIFEIDLRLRPYGKRGNLAVSVQAFQKYYSQEGPAWNYERQALVKLRPIMGDDDFRQQVLHLRDTVLYQGDSLDVASMRAMRERQLRQLVAGGTINAKFSPGALVDLEYLIQHLQIHHGRFNPDLRVTNTHEAILKLNKAGILNGADYKNLTHAHLFLLKLIEALRMVRGNAKDLTVPPHDSKEYAFLVKRLGYFDNDKLKLHDDLIQYTSLVREISSKLLSSNK